MVLKTIDVFIQHVQKNTGFRVDFSTTSSGKKYNSLFTKAGIAEMLKAKNISNIDCVLHFTEAIVDRCRGEDAGEPVTDVFFRYSEILMGIY